MESTINIFLAILQVLVLIFQVLMAERQYNDSKSAKRGMFQIAYRNVCLNYFDRNNQNGPAWIYDLSEPVSFKNIGKDIAFITEYEIKVGNNVTAEKQTNISFLNNDEFSVLTVDFNLNDEELKRNRIDIILTLRMKNTSGFEYYQIITMGFEKSADWKLVKYDFKFKEIGLYQKLKERLCKTDK